MNIILSGLLKRSWVLCFKSSMYSLCHVPCDLEHVLYTHTDTHAYRTHKNPIALRACLHYSSTTAHRWEKKHISLSCHHCLTRWMWEQTHISQNFCKAWCIPASNMLSYVVVLCVFISAVFTHISLLPILHVCVLYVPLSGPFLYCCEWIESVFDKTEPNQIDASCTRFDNSMWKKGKKAAEAAAITTITRWTLSACVSGRAELSSTRFLVIFIHFFSFWYFWPGPFAFHHIR